MMLQAAFQVFKRDLRLGWRQSGEWLNPLIFLIQFYLKVFK